MKNEILTVNGGNSDLLLQVSVLDGDVGYDLTFIGNVIFNRKVETGIEFTHYSWSNDFTNCYFRYVVELDSNGVPSLFRFESDRKLSDVDARTTQDYFFFDSASEGATKYWKPEEFGILENSFNHTFDINNIDMFRVLKWVNLSKSSWSDETISFVQFETTGLGTGLNIDITFEGGTYSSHVINSAGLSHSAGDVVTMRNMSSEDFFVKVETVDGDGGVLTIIATDDLTPEISKYDLVRYDFLTDTVTVAISDIEEWWNINADEPWIIDGGIPSFKGGQFSNPIEPIFIGSRSGDFPSSSFMISENNFFRFSDNKMVDNQIRIFTKNKAYIGSIWAG
jgi:hypothetical protein